LLRIGRFPSLWESFVVWREAKRLEAGGRAESWEGAVLEEGAFARTSPATTLLN